jgi:AhpD family alkylhydroperoxidase
MQKSKSDSSASSSIFTPATAELVAIGAAIGANCEPCFKYHYSQARKLGVSRDDMAKAVELANRVKRAPAQNMLALADKILGTDLSNEMTTDPNPGSCCSADAAKAAKPVSHKGCDRRAKRVP